MMFDMSLLELVLKASLVVQAVMGVLLLISIVGWMLIFAKRFTLSRARRIAHRFEEDFWKGKDLTALYNRITSQRHGPRGVEHLFVAGYTEYAKLRRQSGVQLEDLLGGTQRAMRVALQREMDKLDADLTTLSTIGSVSPYIGLFGTVWGIMHAFHALGGMEQVTLAMVAPGISEALIATAMGLFAAIPAVIAYNAYVNEIEKLLNRYDTFSEEFTSLLQRQAYTSLQAQQARTDKV